MFNADVRASARAEANHPTAPLQSSRRVKMRNRADPGLFSDRPRQEHTMRQSIRAVIATCVAGLICLAVIPLFAQTGSASASGAAAFGDWRADRPGTRRLIRPQDLPAPDLAASASNVVRIVRRTNEQKPIVPNGFEVNLFASGLSQRRA